MLDQDIKNVLRTTTNHLKTLKELNINTVKDLLLYFPRDYDDQSEVTKIIELTEDEKYVVKGVISNITTKRTNSKYIITNALLTDDTGSIEITWFNQPFIKNILKSGDEIFITGKIKFAYGKYTFSNPLFESVNKEQVHTSRIVPIYHQKELKNGKGKISSKWIRDKLHPLIYMADYLIDPLPKEIINRQNLISYTDAIKEIHFPTSKENLNKAKERLAFNELFLLQLSALQKKWLWKKGVGTFNKKITQDNITHEKFLKLLPYTLTNAQKRTLNEIFTDLKGDFPMLRLLQGDVGSGKTVVAAGAILQCVKANMQATLMAPTAILATQHYEGLKKILSPFNITIELFVGNISIKNKKILSEKLKNGEIDIAVGTHALIQDNINFNNLGLAVVDEQHRFGVKQRDKLKEFGNPHLLNMSATPIPRTLALTVYGDQDISIIDEMPPGRQTIMTRIVPENKRKDAYNWINSQVKDGRQVFIICPLVEESDKLNEVKAATEEYERLKTHIFTDLKLGLLHGRLKQEEKDEIMQRFAKNEINVLISTSVVEVGIDVPNATIIVIEGAERFGLSQLHQFRGRVGRGKHQSYCFLFKTKVIEDDKDRLTAMVKHSSGFELSEIDLQLRGPGEVFGVKQSGVPDLKMANFSDGRIIKKAREEAELLIKKDPLLKEHLQIQELLI